MSKKMTLELSEELIADIGFAKIYIEKLMELKRNYPHSIQGDQQNFYINRADELLQKASSGIGVAIKNKKD